MDEDVDECEDEINVEDVSSESEESDEDLETEAEGAKVDQTKVVDEPVKLSWFKRTFPYTKHDKGLPLATERAHMVQRRPLWLPKFGLDMAYFKHASYFSEIIAREQLSRQMLIDALYKPKYGEYKLCKTTVIKKQFLSKYLLGVHSCKFSPDGKFLVLGFGNGSIEVFNLRNKEREVLFMKGQPRKITSIRFKNKKSHTFFASSLTGRVYLAKKLRKRWNCYSFLKEFKNEINGMDISPNGYHLATAGKDACIRIYDVNHKKLIQAFSRAGIDIVRANKNEESNEIAVEGHYKRICAIRYNPSDENLFVTGGWDNIVKIWDIRSGTSPVRCINGPHICGDAIDIMEKNVLTGQWTSSDSLQLWDLSSCKLITNISPLNRPICYSGEFINSARFIRSWEGSPIKLPKAKGDLIIAAGSGTKALEVISIKENVVLHAAEEANAVVALDSYRHLISYGSVNNIYSILSFYPFAGKLSLNKKLLHENEQPTTTNKETGRTETWIPVGIDQKFIDHLEELKKLRNKDLKTHEPSPKESFIRELIQEIQCQEGSGPNNLLEEKLEKYIGILNQSGISPPQGRSVSINRKDLGTFTLVPKEESEAGHNSAEAK